MKTGAAAAACLVLVVGSISFSAAYERITHGQLTEAAATRSTGLGEYFSDIGLDPTSILDSSARTRESRLGGVTNDGTARGWMLEGAVREDDFQRHPWLELLGCAAPQNPPSAIDRMLAHFLDVQHGDRGLAVVGVDAISAADWALGEQGRGPAPTDNQFSLLDARRYQLASLTAPTRAERERNTALLFRTLGHVVHLVQDMAQPQHTRNDRHAGCLGALGGEESWYERYVDARARRVGFRTRGAPAPPLALEGHEAPAAATFRELFTGGRGLADFSGRQFFSAGTNLSLLGACAGLAEPPCSAAAYVAEDRPFVLGTLDGGSVAGSVRVFLRDVEDRATGTIVPGVALTSRSLWDQHLERRGLLPVYTLNTLNYDDAAALLLPRAVGYSAALLERFFRGRLDVDLVADPLDPSVVRLRGTNLSPDRLDGTLALHADVPAAGGGEPVRAPAAIVGGSPLVTAEPDGAIESAAFRLPAGAERFMAVYQGTLGSEAPRDPMAPGGVVGRHLGGVRLEQVFADGDTWKIRTPRGVFALPLATRDWEDVTWGDDPDTLVARSPDVPARVAAYGLARVPGSIDPVTAGMPPVVPLVRRATAVLPFATPPLVTTVRFDQVVHYRQRVVEYDRTRTWQWETGVWFGQPGGRYVGPESTVGTARVVTLNEQDVPFAATIPIVLDAEHDFDAGSTDEPYVWALTDVGVDRAGRLVGTVVVYLTRPPGDPVGVRVLRLTEAGTPEPTSSEIDVEPAFPPEVGVLLWALVDLSTGQILASTAEPEVRVAWETTVEGPPWDVPSRDPYGGIWVHETEFLVGGPTAGPSYEGWWPESALLVTADLATVFATVDGRDGAETLAVRGSVREDLAGPLRAAGLLDFRVGDVATREALWGVDCATGVCRCTDTRSSVPCVAVRATLTRGGTASPPVSLALGLRARPAPPGRTQRMVFLGDTDRGVLLPAGHLIVWDPETGYAAVRDHLEGNHDVGPWPTASSVVVYHRPERFLPGESRIVALDGDGPPRVFPRTDLRWGFVLLDPTFLYSTRDLRFHRLVAPLEPTALPAQLADAPALGGDFHAVRLP